jgi:uncharacterized protein (UPF0548 family)
MFSLSKPSQAAILAFISSQKSLPFSYAEVGATRDQAAPKRYTIDHNRVKLGQGPETFKHAKNAIRNWTMFRMPWIDLCWPDAPVQSSTVVAVLVSHLGFWSLNAARIVYVVEEHGAVEKYGFAYGTLPEHGEIGEERFTVEFNPADSSVWYDLYAFSRPHGAARVGYPFSRKLQERFARDSKAAMQNAIKQPLDA